MGTSTPALIAVLYSASDTEATLCLRGHCQESQRIKVTHEGRLRLRQYSMPGNGGDLCGIQVSNGDELAIEVWQAGVIAAYAILEVRISLSEIYGAIVVPMACSGLLIDQRDASAVERGDRRALEAVFAPAETAVAR